MLTRSNRLQSHHTSPSTSSSETSLNIGREAKKESDSALAHNLRASARIRESSKKSPVESSVDLEKKSVSPNKKMVTSPSKIEKNVSKSQVLPQSSANLDEKNQQPKENQEKLDSSLVTVRVCNNRKIHTCEKCGLEFTSANSVSRHQEKSCLRVRVINLKSSNASSSSKTQQKEASNKKKCPICSSIFFNTHRVSIHIYKHHKNLLGSAVTPPNDEAKRLQELQLVKTGAKSSSSSKVTSQEAESSDLALNIFGKKKSKFTKPSSKEKYSIKLRSSEEDSKNESIVEDNSISLLNCTGNLSICNLSSNSNEDDEDDDDDKMKLNSTI